MIEKNEIAEKDPAKAAANNKKMRRRDFYSTSAILVQVVCGIAMLHHGEAPATRVDHFCVAVLLFDLVPTILGTMWLLYRYPRRSSFFLNPWTAAIMGFLYFYLKLIKK